MSNLITSQDFISRLLFDRYIRTWDKAIKFIQAIPYGRTTDRTELSLVITENRGTCSSKHALLKHIANHNNIAGVKLILGMYKMNHLNTPGVGIVLRDHNLAYIPEAHCYLKINGNRHDFTSPYADIKRLEKDILEELEIQPSQVVTFKVEYHKNYIENWLEMEDSLRTIAELWHIREKCISNLSG